MRKLIFALVIICLPFWAFADGAQQLTLTKDIVAGLKSVMGKDAGKKTTEKVYYFEFFDVHCSYCRARDKEIHEKLHPFYVNYPFLGPRSEPGATALVVASLVGKEQELKMHEAIMSYIGALDERQMEAFAQKILKLSPAQYQAKAKSTVVSKELASNAKLIDDLNVATVPAILIISPHSLQAQSGTAVLWTGPFEDEKGKALPEFRATVAQVEQAH
jgi:protein-disulfide isomerase